MITFITLRLSLAAMTLWVASGIQASTVFSTKADWLAAAGTPTTSIDFSTKDDGTPITNPAADLGIASLVLSDVEFIHARSYYNKFLYVFPRQPLRAVLPASTRAVGVNLSPFYPVAGTYTITLSTGEAFTRNPALVPWTMDFFGVLADEDIEWIEFTLDTTYLTLDNFEIVQRAPLVVAVDFKPESAGNNVNPDSNAMVPVAVLSADGFDPGQIDLSTVRFGLTGTEAGIQNSSFEDLNGDGIADLIAGFRIRHTGIVCGTEEAWLSGRLLNGREFFGSDTIRTVGCK